MESVVLFRNLLGEENQEIAECSCIFSTYHNRAEIPKGSLVIPRYSALPFYLEMEKDIEMLGSQLINSYRNFKWIANFEYYDVLKEYTFITYFDPVNLPDNKSFIVKGKTNSRKHNWNSHCFAKNKKDAIQIYCELKNDGLIGSQDIIFREYEPLVQFEVLANGLPVCNEFRFFFYKNVELCHGYYWANAEYPEKGKLDDKAFELVDKVSNIVAEFNNFFVIDIAQKANGEWIVVELNSGEMSGLSLCSASNLYSNLAKHLCL